MATTSEKLENCEVCNTEKAKYTCPKCEVRTCCLTCVNIHKKELECNGIRDKTKYIPKEKFTNLDLLSDYRLLEDVGKTVDSCKRNPEKWFTRQANLPVHLYKLRCAASNRKMLLLFMPQKFNRHKRNTTYLKWKTNELYWRIELIFPQAENIMWTVDRVLEDTRLATLVEQVVDPVFTLEDKVDIAELNVKLNLAEKLRFYKAAGLNDIKVLLKAEKVKKCNSRFYELDLTLTLKENLENKTIIEFPTLFVIMKNHSDMYELVETDEETSDTKYVKRPVKKGRYADNEPDNEKKSNDAVNYFFNDFSESDDEKTNNELDEKKRSLDLNIPNYEELVQT